MDNNSAYRDLKPGSAEHKAFIANALKTQNIAHLQAVKGRSGMPIRIVSNWIYYQMLRYGHQRPDVVVIYTDEQIEVMDKFFESIK